jgi:hypothetical protein
VLLTPIGVFDDIRTGFIDSSFNSVSCQTIKTGIGGRVPDKFPDFCQTFVPTREDNGCHEPMTNWLKATYGSQYVVVNFEESGKTSQIEGGVNVGRDGGEDDLSPVVTFTYFLDADHHSQASTGDEVQFTKIQDNFISPGFHLCVERFEQLWGSCTIDPAFYLD